MPRCMRPSMAGLACGVGFLCVIDTSLIGGGSDDHSACKMALPSSRDPTTPPSVLRSAAQILCVPPVPVPPSLSPRRPMCRSSRAEQRLGSNLSLSSASRPPCVLAAGPPLAAARAARASGTAAALGLARRPLGGGAAHLGSGKLLCRRSAQRGNANHDCSVRGAERGRLVVW